VHCSLARRTSGIARAKVCHSTGGRAQVLAERFAACFPVRQAFEEPSKKRDVAIAPH
jgi:hypothetical protein